MDNAFAELRALCNQPVWSLSDRKRLVSLAHELRRSYRARYDAQCVPYMRGFERRIGRDVFGSAKGAQAANTVLALIPGVRLEVGLGVKDLKIEDWHLQPWFEHVTRLQLDGMPLSDEVLSAMTRRRAPPNLRHVDLSNGGFSVDGLLRLCAWLPAQSMETLKLNGATKINDWTIKSLMTWLQEWPALRFLNLVRTGVGQHGAEAVLEMGWSRGTPSGPPLHICLSQFGRYIQTDDAHVTVDELTLYRDHALFTTLLEREYGDLKHYTFKR